jgi:hypothetical protein
LIAASDYLSPSILQSKSKYYNKIKRLLNILLAPRYGWRKEQIYDFQQLIKVLRFEVFTAVTMNNGVFWVVTPCGVTTQKTPFFNKGAVLLY